MLTSLDGFDSDDKPATQVGLDGGDGGKLLGQDGATLSSDGSLSNESGDSSTPAPVSKYRESVMFDKPIAYWRFGEPKDALEAIDEVKGAKITYPRSRFNVGVPGALAGDSNTAIRLDGSSVEIAEGFSFDGFQASAVEFWFRPNELVAELRWILDHQNWGTVRTGWGIHLSDNGLTYERWATNTYGAGVNGITSGQWNHYVVSVDEKIGTVYLNGVRGERNGIAEAMPATTKWTIGAITCTACGDRFIFKGDFDELAFYDHGLSADAIGAHFAAAKGQ